MRAAVGAFHARRFEQAEALYRHVLAEDPDYADALNLLGLVLAESSRPEEGLEFIGRAIARNPELEVVQTGKNSGPGSSFTLTAEEAPTTAGPEEGDSKGKRGGKPGKVMASNGGRK